MKSLPIKLAVATVGLAFVLATPADSQTRKNRTQDAASPPQSALYPNAPVKGANIVMFGNEYLGADPDPNIRAQLLRDLTAHFGGNQ